MEKNSIADYIEAIASRLGLSESKRRIARIRRLEKRTNADFGGGTERIFQKELGYSASEGNDYTASPEAYVDKMCKGRIKEGDSILDIGCGKGYAMYIMGRYPFNRIYGLEKSDMLANACVDNLQCIYGTEDARFKVYAVDATTIDNTDLWEALDDIDYVYMYNPFPEEVAGRVISLLDKKAREIQWQVTVWYAAPDKGALIRMLQSECFKLKGVREVGRYQIVYVFDSIYIEEEE